MPTYSDEDLLEELRRVADVADADGAPSIPQFNEHSDIAASTIRRRFGSWNKGVSKAGFEPNPYGSVISDDELAAELKRLREAVGHPPMISEMNEQGAYSVTTYKNRFGSWRAALFETFEDVSEETLDHYRGDDPHRNRSPSDRSNWSKGPHVSDDELLDDLKALADDLDRTPTSKDMRKHGPHSAHTYMKRFDSWTDALEAAGLDTPDQNNITDAELIADLHRLRDELGERPTSTDVARDGEYGLATYQRRFGSWGEAAAAAFDDETDTQP